MLKKCFIVSKSLALLAALCLTAIPGVAAADKPGRGPQDGSKQDSVTHGRSETGGQSYGDHNRGGTRGFYSYPLHRHIDGGSGGILDRRQPPGSSAGMPPYCNNCHGSAYYGRDYGAPYFGGGYYDRGIYYRERRD